MYALRPEAMAAFPRLVQPRLRQQPASRWQLGAKRAVAKRMFSLSQGSRSRALILDAWKAKEILLNR